MPKEESRLKLSRTNKYVTANPEECFRVLSGTVNVYVAEMSENNTVVGRSMYICDKFVDDGIPSLSVTDSVEKKSWVFLLDSFEGAEIAIFRDQSLVEPIREDFIKSQKELTDSDERFSVRIINWYNKKLEEERIKIEKTQEEKENSLQKKLGIMSSLFVKDKSNIYSSNTDSPIYNAMAILCDYMKIKICSYQVVEDAYGDDISVEKIARLSHFVVRKISLTEGWYKRNGGVLLAFDGETENPILCVPKGTNKYVMYDIANQRDCVVEEEEARSLSEEAYIAYPHLPAEKQTLKAVLEFGYKRIPGRDINVFFSMYIIVTLLGLLLPFLNELVYDTLIPIGEREPIFEVGMVILSCMIGNIFFEVVKNLASFRAVKSMEYTIVAATYDRIFRLPQKFIDQFGTMEFVNRVSSVSGVFTTTVSSGVSALVGFVLSLFYLWRMFDKSSKLAFRGIIIALISCAVTYLFGRARIKYEKARLEESTKANGMLYQFMSGILKIKVSGIENRSLYEFQKRNVKTLGYDVSSSTINNKGSIASNVITLAGTMLIYYVVVKKKQYLSVGEYAAFDAAYGMFSSAIGQLVSFFLTYAQLQPVMDRIKPIFEEEAEITDAAIPIGDIKGSIEIKNVDFRYDEKEKPVLRNINMSILQGEFIGIVGPSGCGKSTLLKLLMGFEKPTSGKIFYDNRDIDSLDKCELRRRIGVVLQDGKMVVGNIYSNVSLAAPNISGAKVEELLDEVGLLDDVKRMPMGIFTAISEGGGTMSGGQQQRILIARALANDPSMVFFDEATSALDNITQQKVCDRLAKRNVTRVMIAHRLSTVKGCDKIFVMDNGEIVETGNFEELMEKKGMFYNLAKRQQVE